MHLALVNGNRPSRLPCIAGIAKDITKRDVRLLLDAIVDYLPSPADRPHARGHHPKTGEVDKALDALAVYDIGKPLVEKVALLPLTPANGQAVAIQVTMPNRVDIIISSRSARTAASRFAGIIRSTETP